MLLIYIIEKNIMSMIYMTIMYWWWCTDKKIVPVGSKVMHLPLCLLWFFKTSYDNETDYFDWSICEMNNKCDQSI